MILPSFSISRDMNHNIILLYTLAASQNITNVSILWVYEKLNDGNKMTFNYDGALSHRQGIHYMQCRNIVYNVLPFAGIIYNEEGREDCPYQIRSYIFH